jgi:hypothetical protein
MNWIRREMRWERLNGLTVPQLRVLVYLQRHDGASLTQVADFIGGTLSYASRLVERLVADGLVTRLNRADNRRSMTIALTPAGQASPYGAAAHPRPPGRAAYYTATRTSRPAGSRRPGLPRTISSAA